jgi:hypothetical protein
MAAAPVVMIEDDDPYALFNNLKVNSIDKQPLTSNDTSQLDITNVNATGNFNSINEDSINIDESCNSTGKFNLVGNEIVVQEMLNEN